MDFLNTEEIIKDSKKILIISHINPDGDALGSTFGLYSAIYERFKKKCDICILSHIPSSYAFLPYFKEGKTSYDKSLVYDLVITVDVASLDRLKEARILFDRAKITINIDHHKTNNGFAKFNYIVPNASSTGEILFNMFKNSGWSIDKDTAECLYTAILTDTGGFRYDNTTKEVFYIAAELAAAGVNPNKIYTYCYELKSKDYVMFQNYCIGKAVFLDDNKIVYTVIYRKDFEKYNAKDDYTEGIAEQLRAIKSVDIAFVVKELESKICKISIRSKEYDAARICSAFGGGGHSRAAGCTIKSNVNMSVKKILDEIKGNGYKE